MLLPDWSAASVSRESALRPEDHDDITYSENPTQIPPCYGCGDILHADNY